MGYRTGPTSARHNDASDSKQPHQWKPQGSGGTPATVNEPRHTERSTPMGQSLPTTSSSGDAGVSIQRDPNGDSAQR